MKKNVAIVMDSTGYLTSDLVDQLNITVIPLTVTIGKENFPENELSNSALFAKMDSVHAFPTTSQPSVGSFLKTYQTLAPAETDEIVSIHLSKAISGTLETAQMVKDQLGNPNIYIFDSGASALGLGILVWAAAEWARQGLSAPAIIKNLASLKERMEIYFLVDNLDYLHRGGRIGGASHLFGSLLNVKPILYFNEKGEIDAFAKIRSKAKAWERILQELKRALADKQCYRLCAMHVHKPEEGERILAELKAAFPGHEIRLFECGPVIASHVGPGALGLVFAPWPYPQTRSCPN